ncbi:MAG: YlxR family protein [Clostridiales bacterium]|nr:YlxR family protein [Clostridiales bacterium]
MKKIPQRMCVTCRTRRDKKDLLRIVADEEGNVKYDPTGKAPGRGAYLCRNKECIEQEIKSRRLQKGLKTGIDKDEIGRLAEEILKLCSEE